MHNIERVRITSSPEEDSYERTLRKREFLDSISEKYSNHTRLLTDTNNFNHMLKAVDRFNEYYSYMLNNMNDPEFDFTINEKKFDAMIEEDKTIINHLNN
ncbi:MAG: hypothetical protein IT280_13345 [Ignavibacteria bacterium]|nr:hypothetical protein [Ignavibacteria bacterium]